MHVVLQKHNKTPAAACAAINMAWGDQALFKKNAPFFKRKKRLRPPATRKHGLGLPKHIKIILILINIAYFHKVWNKPFVMVYYIEFPTRIQLRICSAAGKALQERTWSCFWRPPRQQRNTNVSQTSQTYIYI